MTCRYEGCTQPVAVEGMSRCERHTLRWLPGKPAERVPVSPFTRRAMDRKLPAKVVA